LWREWRTHDAANIDGGGDKAESKANAPILRQGELKRKILNEQHHQVRLQSRIYMSANNTKLVRWM